MNKEIRSTSSITLLGLDITKTVNVNDQEVDQFFEFTYKGIPCMIVTYGCNFTKKTDYCKRYSGFGETWSHCAYMTFTEEQLCIIAPQFIININIPVDEEEHHSKDYAYEVFHEHEVTFTEKLENGSWKIGIDYQHSYNNADNTDLLTVLLHLIDEADHAYEILTGNN